MSRKKKKETFAPRIPLGVSGGIRVQSSRSGFARKWWSRQWLLLLEKYQIGARLGRGRSYAYAGQIASLELQAGSITAAVQGADKGGAYACEIGCVTATATQRGRIVGVLREHPLLLAQLLVRELPQPVETIFVEAGLSLVPLERAELTTRCSCPDRVNPCKHLAAVFFLLIEAFEQDPLLLLELRGVPRTALLDAPAAEGDDDDREAAQVASGRPPEAGRTPENHAGTDVWKAADFWGGGDDGEEAPDFGPAPTGNAAAPLVRRLGPIPMWRGEERFMDVMMQVGSRAAAVGWQAWAGERMRRPRTAPRMTNPNMRLRRTHMRIEV